MHAYLKQSQACGAFCQEQLAAPKGQQSRWVGETCKPASSPHLSEHTSSWMPRRVEVLILERGGYNLPSQCPLPTF